MNWDALGAIAEVIGGLGVILTLVYLAIQIRGSNRVASAQSRHAMSEFALNVSKFRAEHADRIARVNSDGDLTDGDKEFQYWNHMQMMLFTETYFHQHELGLMPDSHWRPFAHYIVNYFAIRGFREFWVQVGPSFSEDFREWINEQYK
ncbi:MAG: hypothetical protein O2971_07705 [Proteobacteria bacterium]|nr:hypothetical protein [Pseudomonadota bacterium]